MSTFSHVSSTSQILLVDDSLAIRKMVRKCLQELGFSAVLEARDGEEAISVLSSASVSLIVCDWHMPKMSGLELLRYVRTHKDTATLPFIMLTSDVQEQSVRQAIEAGVSHYVRKPFTASDLDSQLSSVLKRTGPGSSKKQ